MPLRTSLPLAPQRPSDRSVRRFVIRSTGLALLVLAVLAMGACKGPTGPEDFEATIRAGEGLGDRVRLQSLHGNVVVLDFWAHWCDPCYESAPAMNRLHEKFTEKGVLFYGVNTEANLSPRRLIEEHARLEANFPSFHDTSSELGDLYQVSSLPTLVILGREGKISSRHFGLVNEQRVEAAIEAALSGR